MRTSISIFLAIFIFTACDSDQQTERSLQQTTPPKQALDILTDHSAHWLSPDVLMVQKTPTTRKIRLHYSLNAEIEVSNNAVILNNSPYLDIKEISNSASTNTHRPFTQGYVVTKPVTKINDGALKALIKGQLVVIQYGADEEIIKASQVQRAKLIDTLYTSGENDADEVSDYGATITDNNVQFKLWAPTARDVQVLLFDRNKKPLSPSYLNMHMDTNSGVWSAVGKAELEYAYYQYKISLYHPATQALETVTTTDPYSLSLSTNSIYSQVVDLNHTGTKPKGWDSQSVAELKNYEDSILYELHIRDFSAVEQNISNQSFKGKYKAFSEKNSHGIKHLQTLKKSGLTHIHLLPTFDIATINEDPKQTIYQHDKLKKVCRIAPDNFICQGNYNEQWSLQQLLESYSPTSNHAQEVIESLRQLDPYNWGYDPYHYTVPEGSYALAPEGISRIVEFREMIKSIHDMGFRVIMDVVYNHTFSARLTKESVLDKIVPDYYHRLNTSTGDIEQSTCCDNTATENIMMGKLMIDSLAVWARDYKIDGFRFDLMGHQPKELMLKAYERIKTIDPDNYFYGEGWNFGEVQNNKLFAQATQTELAGTQIGTFSDRSRDAIRGGAPFHEGKQIRAGQGISNGFVTYPNELKPEQPVIADYLLSMDQARIGLAGNLANFSIKNAQGEEVTGKEVPYGDAATGYALDPADTINYVSKHDNQTLWDNNQYRIPYHTSTEDRVRMQNLALAYPMLSQGIPFIHMGSELLRSKSFLRDSYDYNDWFNSVDFSMQTNNYNVGLPPAVKDEKNWPVILELLKKNEGRDQVTSKHIRFAAQVFMEWLKIRSSSPLLRLNNEMEIIQRVSFHNTGKNQQTGIIALHINDIGFDKKIDKRYESMMIIFNNNTTTQTFSGYASDGFFVHPIQTQGVDSRVKTIAKASNEGFVVPGLSAVVFVKAIP